MSQTPWAESPIHDQIREAGLDTAEGSLADPTCSAPMLLEMKITEKTALKWARSQLEKLYGVNFSWLGRGKSRFKVVFDEYFGPEWERIMGRLVPDSCFLLTNGDAACMGIIEAEWSAPMSRDKLRRYYEMWDYLIDFGHEIKKRRDVVIYTVGNGFNIELRNPCDFFPATLSAEFLLKQNRPADGADCDRFRNLFAKFLESNSPLQPPVT